MKYPIQKGFTLIEIITVLAIFAIVSGIVLFNYGKFRSDTILTNMAYEMALSIREAQIFGVSVRTPGTVAPTSPGYAKSYGIYVPPGTTDQYYLFLDENNDNIFDGTSCTNPGYDTCVTPYKLSSNIKITKIDVRLGGISCPSGLVSDGLHIVFKRPNPEPKLNDNPNIEEVQITLTSSDGITKRFVRVFNNGQVSVVNNDLCSS